MRSSSYKGFSLLEVLITILIVSFGLLGMAALIVSGARSNNVAHYRSIASKQTEDIADRMRANLAGIISGSYDSLAATTPNSSDCKAAVCTATQIAVYDHAQWNSANSILLPDGRGTVTGSLATGFEINLMWTEKEMSNTDDANSNCPSGTPAKTRCFFARFIP
ncbi:type IV pilus assembly protein PilV [Nitrosomonas sp. PY1]|nr:type IV pilus assembly protein PilV [Nitrosomonas sp. PY1]